MTWPHIEYGPHDWPEDASHENGNYNNTCVHCNHIFIGHKRRVCCKVCHRPATPTESLLKKIGDVDEYRNAGRHVAEKLHDLLADYDGEEIAIVAELRKSPYPIINLDDPQQAEKLRGTRIGVPGPGAEAIVEKMRMHGIDAVIHTPGKTTSLPAPDQTVQVFKSEYRSTPKEKAQWKRERNGRR